MTVRRATRTGAIALFAALSLGSSLLGCGDAVASPSSTPSRPAATIPPPTAEPTIEPITFEPDSTDLDTGSPGTPPCDISAVKASHGLNDSDGDDRTTEVVLVAADTCSVDAYPELALRDSSGKVLAHADAAGAGAIDLVGGVAYTSEVRVSNWCLDAAFPIEIRITHNGGTIRVTGDSFPDEENLPPCVHQDASPVLSGTAWAPKS